jgi:hypothetical protein
MAKHKLSGKGLALKSPPRKRRRRPASATSPAAKSLYAVHPSVAMIQKWIHDLPIKTGRTLEQWIRHVKADGPASVKESRLWLKAEYGFGTNMAWWLAEKACGEKRKLVEDTPESYLALAPQYVEQMYAGPRAALRPLYDALIHLAGQLGGDVRICPCKTMVPLYRRHVFAQIKPATSKRIALGLALGDEPFTARLRDTGGLAKKDRITHAVSIAALSDIDLQVKRWIKQAYEGDA